MERVQESMESLSESERGAYEKALWGDWEGHQPEPQFDEEGNEIWVEPDWSEIGGCQNTVQQEHNAGHQQGRKCKQTKNGGDEDSPH